MRLRLAELVRFGLVGLSSTLVYFVVYAALVWAGTPYVLASIAGFGLSAGWGYVLHHRYTFRTQGGSVQSLAGWLALQGTLLGVNVAALSVLVHGAGLDRIVAQLIVLPFIPLLSYAVGRRLVFHRR